MENYKLTKFTKEQLVKTVSTLKLHLCVILVSLLTQSHQMFKKNSRGSEKITKTLFTWTDERMLFENEYRKIRDKNFFSNQSFPYQNSYCQKNKNKHVGLLQIIPILVKVFLAFALIITFMEAFIEETLYKLQFHQISNCLRFIIISFQRKKNWKNEQYAKQHDD